MRMRKIVEKIEIYLFDRVRGCKKQEHLEPKISAYRRLFNAPVIS